MDKNYTEEYDQFELPAAATAGLFVSFFFWATGVAWWLSEGYKLIRSFV